MRSADRCAEHTRWKDAVPHIDWDTEDPPTEPPRGADPLVWRLALSLREDHLRYDSEGSCVACRGRWPCRLRIAAEQGLVLAVRRPGPLAVVHDPAHEPGPPSPRPGPDAVPAPAPVPVPVLGGASGRDTP